MGMMRLEGFGKGSRRDEEREVGGFRSKEHLVWLGDSVLRDLEGSVEEIGQDIIS